MKSTLLLIALSFTVTYSLSQTTSVPDPVFEQALIDQGIDTNGLNGNILNSDASIVQYLSVSGLGISDLSGIEAFNSLLGLYCDNNLLTTLDLSNISTLTYIDCSYNSLTNLNLGVNNLESFYCSSNLITSLDLSSHSALLTLDCSQNLLNVLNLKNGNNTSLYLYANDNPNLYCIEVDDTSYSNYYWTNIDAQAYFSFDCSNIQTTYVPDNNFEQALINLGHDDVLDDYVLMGRIMSVTTLDLSYKNISNLSGIEDFIALKNLNCNNNLLSNLNISSNINLENLNCSSNSITSLNVANNTALKNLSCQFNAITSLDLSTNNLLETLNCSNNSITSLNVTNDAVLTDLNCYNNKISTLDFSTNTALKTLNCNKNLLSSLNVTNNSALTDLSCGENYTTLTSIDVSQNLNLKILNIQSNNWMTSLDVTNNTALENLGANGAPITNLDLTHNTALLALDCQYCNLSTLNVSQNVALLGINVSYNYLVNLDLSDNVNLYSVVAIYNSLESLNVKNGNNTKIGSSFNVKNNNLLTCITVDDVAFSQANWSFGVDNGVTFSTNCALGVEEFNKEAIKIYPNPILDKIFIDFNSKANYLLTNIFGQQILKGSIVSGINEVVTKSLASGLYLIKIESPEGSIVKKLIKE